METLRRDPGASGRDRGAASPHLAYLSSLDGLRAVSVLGVVAYHAEPDLVPGGFLGVDVFFVISGFLITSLLLREQRNERRIDLRRFWRRRARRLGPALLSVLTAVAVAGWAWTPDDQLDRLRGDGLATLGYLMNWRLIAQGDSYFDTFAAPSPLRHLWSLAVEEQFYLAWPLVVVAVLAWRRALLGPVAVIAGAASVWAMGTVAGGASRVYYGTDTHLFVVMTGCALAVLADRRPGLVRRVVPTTTVPLVASVGLVTAMFAVGDDDTGFLPPGLLAFSLTAAVAVAGSARHGHLPVLSHPLLVEVGKRSYGLYLWHWPVEVFLTDARVGLGHAASTIVRLGVSFGLTWVSYALIEQPVRRSRLSLPRWWLVLPLAVAVLYVGIGWADTDRGFEEARPDEVRTVEADRRIAPPEAAGTSIESVVIAGDSVATSMADGLAEAFAARGVDATIATHPGCGVTEGLAVTESGDVPGFAEACPAQLDALSRVIAETDPDLVLVVAHADSFRRRLDDDRLVTPETDPDTYEKLLGRAVDRLSAGGATIALALAAPVTVDEPGATNERIELHRQIAVRVAEGRDDLVLVDEREIVCPDRRCLDQLDGVELRPDGIHYSERSEQVIAPLLVEAALTAANRR